MIVYVDSNILFNDPYLSSTRFKTVLDNVSSSNGKIKIPYVVHEETINNLVIEVSKLEISLLKDFKALSKKLHGSGVLNSISMPSLE